MRLFGRSPPDATPEELEALLEECRTGRVAPFERLLARARRGELPERLSAIRAMGHLAFHQPVGAPLAELTADPDVAEAARETLAGAASGPADPRPERDAVERWSAEFADWTLERRDLDPEEFPPVAVGSACLLAHHTDRREGPAGGWQASEVAAFFRGDYPLECGLDDDALDVLPRAVRMWFAFLEETGRLDPAARPAIEEAIAEGEATYAEFAREARRLGIGTRVVMQMRRRGLDPGDEGARREWEEAMEASIVEILPARRDSDLARRGERERAKREKLRRKRAERARRRNRGR